ncbi:MAG: prepilin-type N-terminal cleavage/methylation domain-containing protein [Firmicutes bacterium]|nr:prepilin-type N-terminal cleavage/methylation domain-containing protein [Bacillota bacterium]
MMKLMNKKLTKKGFTLAELLIVVAILAILVAVSIPIFTSKLHDAKDSTDMANLRAAKAAAIAAYMSTDDLETAAQAFYWYDADNGKVVVGTDATTKPSGVNAITAYSQCNDSGCTEADAAHGSGKIVLVTIGAKGETVTAEWK